MSATFLDIWACVWTCWTFLDMFKHFRHVPGMILDMLELFLGIIGHVGHISAICLNNVSICLDMFRHVGYVFGHSWIL